MPMLPRARAILAAVLALAACSQAPELGPQPVESELVEPELGMSAAGLRSRVAASADAIASSGIQWNGDAQGRERAHREHGDSSVGTCGDLARRLQRDLLAAGVHKRDLAVVFGEKVRVRFRGSDVGLSVPLELNGDHAALMVRAVPEPLVFDLWMHGRERGTLAGFGNGGEYECEPVLPVDSLEASEPVDYCSMPLSKWLQRMRELDYQRFGYTACDGAPVDGPGPRPRGEQSGGSDAVFDPKQWSKEWCGPRLVVARKRSD
ncbi:MAG: hypothetical protein AB8H80_17390 [Planctomycetota bacterium]